MSSLAYGKCLQTMLELTPVQFTMIHEKLMSIRGILFFISLSYYIIPNIKNPSHRITYTNSYALLRIGLRGAAAVDASHERARRNLRYVCMGRCVP